MLTEPEPAGDTGRSPRVAATAGAAPRPGRRASVAALTLLVLIAQSSAGWLGAAQHARADPAPTASPEAPAFTGVVHPVRPVSDCPTVLPAGMRAPFGPNTRTLTAADYSLFGCWEGTLSDAPFVLGLYFSHRYGGGVAVRYNHLLVANVLAGSGPPEIVRFTGQEACWVEQAGAIYGAADIQTGRVLSHRAAQRLCPPPVYPPPSVLGLAPRAYPFLLLFPTPMPRVTGTIPPERPPAALPRTGGGGMATSRMPAPEPEPRSNIVKTVG